MLRNERLSIWDSLVWLCSATSTGPTIFATAFGKAWIPDSNGNRETQKGRMMSIKRFTEAELLKDLGAETARADELVDEYSATSIVKPGVARFG